MGIWRLWDGEKGRIWYEWCCEVYLPVSGGGGGSMERTGSTGGIGGLTLNAGRSVSAGPGPGSGLGFAPQLSPMMDAPFSPGVMMPAPKAGGGERRVKIGQTSLHNPGGSCSWVGL